MQRLFTFLLTLPLLLATFTLPANATATRSGGSAAHGSTPPDSQIEATLNAKLAKSKVGKDGFKFHVQHGVVTWEGKTAVMQHKGSATRMARTAGASQVINNIQVSASAKAKAASNLKKAAVVE